MNFSLKILIKGEIFHNRKNSLLLDKAYSLYKNTWSEIFSATNFSSDSFLRQDIYILIFDGLTPIGCCAMSQYNFSINVCKDHSYFKSFCNKALDTLDHLKLDEIFTIELLTVSPEYRGQSCPYNIYNSILQVLMNLIRDLRIESAIAPTVNTNNAANGAAFHGVRLTQDISYKDLSCDLIYMTEQFTPDIRDIGLRDLVNNQYENFRKQILKFKKENKHEKFKNVS
ncbi:hypothetical protein [Halobacteriovorax sp. ZH4_bin.1]|uniref:hypothetical protein n=1 Tax=unclassified Halobacteriovorax TaxID=2639665 RepID=UPI00371C84B6